MAALYKQLDSQYSLMQAYAMLAPAPAPPVMRMAPTPLVAAPGLASFVLHAAATEVEGAAYTGSSSAVPARGGVASVLSLLPPTLRAS